jgi:regulator of sirC expression with transglutaminase-like and TPR domain
MTDIPASPNEIRALARLLDDPDGHVQASVRNRLDELGHRAVPHLLSIRDDADASLQPLIDSAIHDLHFEHVLRAWTLVMDAPDVNLERGAFLLALYRFPRLDIPAYRRALDDFADRARAEVDRASGVERAFVLADVMCDTLGFSGNEDHYYDPNNSYLNQVIDRRLGIPISLSVVYLLLGARLDLPVYGVNLPAHFLVKYVDEHGEAYLDLFSGGEYVSKEACVRFLLKAGVKPRPAYFQAAAPQTILLRMARNVLAIAHETDQARMVDDLTALLAPWDPSLDA